MRGHDLFAVLQYFDREILRLADFVLGHDPWPQTAERVKTLSNVPCIVHAAPPRIALADVPAHQVTENVIERLILGHFPGPLADHGAEFALEIDEL